MPEIVLEMSWVIAYNILYLIFVSVERWKDLKLGAHHAVISLIMDIAILAPCFVFISDVDSIYFILIGFAFHVVGLFFLVKYISAKFKGDLTKNESLSRSTFEILGVCVVVLFLAPVFIVDWLLIQKMRYILF